VAGGALAAAVSAAGGLGMIGVGSAGSVGVLERQSGIPREAGVRFGIGLIDWAMQPDSLPNCCDSGSPNAPVTSL
jgi:nitronate monooxygenase